MERSALSKPLKIPEKINSLSASKLNELIKAVQEEITFVELEIISKFATEDGAVKNHLVSTSKRCEVTTSIQNGSKSSNNEGKTNSDQSQINALSNSSNTKEEKQMSVVQNELSDRTKTLNDSYSEVGLTFVWKPPNLSIPIRADVRNFDFDKLASTQLRATGRLFDVIMTDPPWQLATSNPTRGVAIGYEQLSDSLITEIPFPKLQNNGLIFIWVINAKYKFALELMEKWGYTLVDEIVWVKRTVNRRLAKSHGFYLQHAKETCLVGRKGGDPPGLVGNIASDVIYSERRGQSQKPLEIYDIIEQLVPGGNYLEIFARRNNLRDNWVSIGNEL